MKDAAMEDRLQERSESIFGRFCKKVSSIDMRMAAGVPAVIGTLLFVAGCAQEAHGQMELLTYGGRAALDAYKSIAQSTTLSLPEFVAHAVTGKELGFGGTTQGYALGITTIGPIASSAAVLLARGLETARGMLNSVVNSLTHKVVNAQTPPVVPAFSPVVGTNSLAMTGIDMRTGFYVEGREQGQAVDLVDVHAELQIKPR
ncbi:hypothetical protein HBO23_33250 [Pseudomonas sp. WS 5532]|uniref:hypothetical protein n=1 Tax=Pseudomonas sp. WS 5532 TaxID=2717495 RepID=UPI001475B3A5|nr:hypothetical protein [Pseudomonas sp. WS 5532]NMX77836.1 hypothetical protein [Pseudomonas sp. WS 5532]